MATRSSPLNPKFVKSAISLLAAVGPPGLSPRLAMARAEVLWRLMSCGTEGATRRQLQRGLRSVSSADLRQILAGAQARGEIEALAVPSGPKGGRPTVRYRYVQRDTTAPTSAPTTLALAAKTPPTG